MQQYSKDVVEIHVIITLRLDFDHCYNQLPSIFISHCWRVFNFDCASKLVKNKRAAS